MTTMINWRGKGRAFVFGDNVPHDGGLIPFSFVMGRVTDPEELIPHLFEQLRPGLSKEISPGDYIVGGRNFSGGKAHVQGLIALQALGVRVLCESMRFITLRAATSLGLPVMHQCGGITALVNDGDEIEADLTTGEVVNCATGERCSFPPTPEGIRQILERGGQRGNLRLWLEDHPDLTSPA